MKVLVISAGFPYPPTDGGRMRIYHLLRHLRTDHAMTFVSFASDEETALLDNLNEISDRAVVAPYKVTGRSLPARVYRAGLWHISQPGYYRTRQMQALINRLLREGDYDLIHIEHPWMAQYVRQSTLPKVVVAVDILGVLFGRQLANAPTWRIPGDWWKTVVNTHYERATYHQMDATIAVSEHDRQELIRRYGLASQSVFAVPSGVDVEYFTSRPQPKHSREIAFVGMMSYFANQDATRWFADDILPLIWRSVPEATFRIIGKDPPQAILDLAARDRRITVTGTVPDVRDELREAAVSVVPMRLGAGIKVKILEAFAHGLPLVTTQMGGEGVDFVPEEHALIADEPGDFANAVVRLLDDSELQERLRSAGRQLVEAHYSWTYLAAGMGEIWERVAAKSVR